MSTVEFICHLRSGLLPFRARETAPNFNSRDVMTTASPKECPSCRTRGRPLKAETLDALLLQESRARTPELEGFSFCGSSDCDTVYFRNSDDTRLLTADLNVPVFQKSKDPKRLACHCFQHSVAELQADVERTGDSKTPDEIKAKCRQGLDRCHLTNPQGVCCLGNVRAVVKQAKHARSLPVTAKEASNNHDCCASTAELDEASPKQTESTAANIDADAGARRGLWSAGGALGAAVLSSACCWLPLALISVGASAAGVAGFFETYRLAFASGAVLLLGGGFYFVYFRKPACAPGEACAVPNPRLQQFNRIMLWAATVLVVAFVAFPEYVGLLIAGQTGDEPEVAAESAAAKVEQTVTRSYAIDGMTCEGCTVHVVEALEKVPGVHRVNVSYEDKTAKVTLTPGEVSDSAILQAVETTGYEAKVLTDGAQRN